MKDGHLKLHELLENVPAMDEEASASIKLFKTNKKLAAEIINFLSKQLPHKRARMLDLGCGFGGLTKLIAETLGFREVYGIDLDNERLTVAKSRGLHVFKLDLEKETFPFPDDYFDLVTTFGVLEHLKFYDNLITESYRVLRDQGLLLISTTNLASYVNRIALLLGYQPRNLEISRRSVVDICGAYRRFYGEIQPSGHISSPTLYALKQLLESYSFKIERVWGGTYFDRQICTNPPNLLVKAIDYILSRRPSLSIRLFICAKKGV